jgi:asparagine synthase (glutamine-hydrolysing)
VLDVEEEALVELPLRIERQLEQRRIGHGPSICWLSMCGIAAVAGTYDDALLESLSGALTHRGPDGGGVFRADGAAVVARRLAILDLPGGEQPLVSEDGRSAIAFNGEIYNVRELRRSLEAEGVRFRTDHSDTELVLRLYERRGIDALDELNGMFAFAILDGPRRKLVAARDRFGIKPLYYTRTPTRFALASELRTLLRVPGVDRTIDHESLWHYLTLRFVPGERSILDGIHRLPPGHLLELDLDTHALSVRRWYRLRFEPDDRRTRDEWAEQLHDSLRAAVSRWSLADVPIACSLSGGLDSSSVVALLAESGARDLRTYTLGFTDEQDAELNELPLARALAERYGTDHHELVVDARELLDDLLEMVWALDEPYGGGLPSWYVFRFMSADVKVAHTGSGGDELFGNYRRFVPFERGRLTRLRQRDVRRYHMAPSYYFSDEEKGTILQRSGPPTSDLLQHTFDESGSRSTRDSVLYLDVATQLPDEFLLMTDRFSMAHSLEARTPFLDHELVELVASIPPGLRTSAGDPKSLLRDAVAGLLTPAHLAAPKRGFVFPLGRWLRRELRPLAERLLSDEYLARQGIFKPGLGGRYLEPHLAGRADESERLWPLLMFQLWHLLYVEQELIDAPSFSWPELAA